MCYLCPELSTLNVVDQRVNINLLCHRFTLTLGFNVWRSLKSMNLSFCSDS